jgi:hypothetical protein
MALDIGSAFSDLTEAVRRLEKRLGKADAVTRRRGDAEEKQTGGRGDTGKRGD